MATPPELGPFCHWLEAGPVSAVLPDRKATGHKGSFGHLLVVAGSAGKTGAALLTGRAALRGGAGLCTLASTASGQQALDAKVVELMTARYATGDDADADSAAVIESLAARARAVAMGPGIPTGAAMRAVVHQVVGRLAVPMVIDADALNLLGTELARVVRAAPGPRILTPHPGEMANILGTSTAAVQAARLDSARRLAADAGAVVVLKGARTLIAAPDGTVFVNPTANAALATAGSGDVLTGLVGALLAQGLDALDAAVAGVFIHGAAGDEAVAERGGGIIAGDLPEVIGRVMAALRRPPSGDS
jgi:NAD(P)H-hydrate epimerase